MNDLTYKIKDLLKQATEERSHFYVASVLKEVLAAINKRDNLIVEQGMQIEETYNVLEGKKVCDFAMSFGLISKAADRMAEISRLTALLDELDDSLSEKHDCP